MFVERFGLSERRACQITGQHRSTQRHQSASRRRPRRRAAGAAAEALGGAPPLGLPARLGRGPRGGLGGEPQEDPAAVARGRPAGAAAEAQAAHGSATRPSRPSGCGPSDPTTSGRWTSSSTPPSTAARLKLLHVVDEHTREALGDPRRPLDRRRPRRPRARPDRPRARRRPRSSSGWTTAPR